MYVGGGLVRLVDYKPFNSTCRSTALVSIDRRRSKHIPLRPLTHIVLLAPTGPLGIDHPASSNKVSTNNVPHAKSHQPENITHQIPTAGSPLLPSSNRLQTVLTTLFLSRAGRAVRYIPVPFAPRQTSIPTSAFEMLRSATTVGESSSPQTVL